MDRLRAVARRDEQASRLAPALTDAKQATVALFMDDPKPPSPPPPPPPDGGVSGDARILAEGLDQVVERIRRDMANHPDAEFEITWRSLH
jgi:hypothetical protein